MRRANDTPTADHSWEEGPARLVVVHGGRIGRQLVLRRDLTTIGRADDCNLRVPHPQLSRHHAAISRKGAAYTIADFGSSNGTFVNGVPVGDDPVELTLGDKIRLGSELVLLFTLHDPIEAQLLQRQRLETLGRLTSGIAHDFNNMIGAVISNVEFLRCLPGDVPLGEAAIADCLADVKSAAVRAAELSQRLVGYARGERLDDIPVDVAEICDAVARLAARTFGRHISVEAETEPQLTVDGDGLDLHQVLMNLCLNARDAMPGGGKLSIDARRGLRDDGTESVVVHVRDTGQGIDERTQQRIFEPFFSTKGKGGFGVGLSTCREIVSRLGGTLGVESAPGAGADFRIELPVTDRVPRARRESTIQPAGEGAPALRVLLVDDEAVVRRSMRRLLEKAGHDVDEVATGEAALRCYADHRHDVVLLDLEMPDMNGENTLERLLALDGDARVLMVSGHGEEERVRALFERGAVGFLHKPWGAGELFGAIDRAIASFESTPPPAGRPTEA